jgi:ribosomal protein L10
MDDDVVDYNPDRLLNALREQFNAESDAALCRMLGVRPAVLSLIRNRKRSIGACLMVRMHELSGMKVAELRKLLGDRRQKFRTGKNDGYRTTTMSEARKISC